MKRCYQSILRLYPTEYREAFAEEMFDTFEHGIQDCRNRGRLKLLSFEACELWGLVQGLLVERVAKWTAQDYYMVSSCGSWAESDLPSEIGAVQSRLKQLIRSMEFAIAHHDFPKARYYSDEERVTRALLERLERERNRGGEERF